MSLPCRIALLGISPADLTLIEPLFRQAPDTDAACGCERVRDLNQADLIIANADDAKTVHALQASRLPATVLLMGTSDAGTGWPVVSRQNLCSAVAQAVSQLTQQFPGTASRPGLAPPAGHPEPSFEATVPFAPLEMMKFSGAGAHHGFDETQPFDRSAASAHAPQSQIARTALQDDAIDARSVLMWRDAQAGPPATPSVPARGVRAVRANPPVHPPTEAAPAARAEPGFPGLAGFESTRDADHLERVTVPGNWREMAQKQAQAQRQAEPSDVPEPASLSSSFADPADYPTLSPALALSGKLPAILLVGAARLAESSLIRALRGFGYPVDYVANGDIARSRLATQEYGFAFLDDVSLGPQTLPVCRALRKRARALGQQPLRVVVIARKGGMLRRLWAQLTGCDAWMTLPLDRKRLGQYLRS